MYSAKIQDLYRNN
uniref:Uncharacterized protein n=1 Tax=Arundo donax TaxID=35708 RepID=A0A0A8Z211_ARUDO